MQNKPKDSDFSTDTILPSELEKPAQLNIFHEGGEMATNRAISRHNKKHKDKVSQVSIQPSVKKDEDEVPEDPHSAEANKITELEDKLKEYREKAKEQEEKSDMTKSEKISFNELGQWKID